MKRHVVLTVLAAAIVTLVIALTGAPSDAGIKGPSCPAPATTAEPATGVFQGCWTFFAAGSCRAVYRDDAGNYTLCGKCGPTGQPNPNGCSSISPQTLAVGLWCS